MKFEVKYNGDVVAVVPAVNEAIIKRLWEDCDERYELKDTYGEWQDWAKTLEITIQID
jgi:hypothetical protein